MKTKICIIISAFLALTCSCGDYTPKVMARFVPERADDFIFENDLVCGRIYGQALESSTISPGIDVWVKTPGPLIADQRYADEIESHKSYHIDWGNGKDCYKVGLSLGAGASSPIVDGMLCLPATNYRSWEILEQTADVVSFVLHYPAWDVDGTAVRLDKTITVEAGSYFCHVDDVYLFDGPDETIEIACGIFRHTDQNTIEAESMGNDHYAIWEHASDQSKEPEDGMIGVAVKLAGAEWTGYTKDERHGVCVRSVRSGEVFSYDFASCWSKGNISSADEWFALVEK